MGAGLDWKSVGIGAAAFAMSFVGALHTMFTSMVISQLQTGQQASILPLIMMLLAAAACAGAATVHYSPNRTVFEGAVAVLLGTWAGILIITVMPVTIQTVYGATPITAFSAGWALLDSLIYPAAAAGGAHWYIDYLKKKGH